MCMCVYVYVCLCVRAFVHVCESFVCARACVRRAHYRRLAVYGQRID